MNSRDNQISEEQILNFRFILKLFKLFKNRNCMYLRYASQKKYVLNMCTPLKKTDLFYWYDLKKYKGIKKKFNSIHFLNTKT